MTQLVCAALPTGDTSPIYYLLAMGLALAAMVAMLIIGSKRKK